MIMGGHYNKNLQYERLNTKQNENNNKNKGKGKVT